MNKLFIVIIFILSAVGAINWGLVGAFDFNLVTYLLGNSLILVKTLYILVGIAGVLLLAGIKCVFTKCELFNRCKTAANIDHNVAYKQKIYSDSTTKEQQREFIAEGGNSQSLKK